ncbi:hypothetical protein OUHCRE3_56660 [Enterobacter hormaechei]
MLQKQVQQADPAPPKLRQGVEYLLGDEVKAPRTRAQGDQGLLPHAAVPNRLRSVAPRILARHLKKQRA